MDKEKFVERVMSMIYSICGCSDVEAEEVLEECLNRVKQRKKEKCKKQQK